MAGPTEPRIADAQNSDECRALLAAQAVLYGEVKRAKSVRLVVVVVVAVLLAGFTIWLSPTAAWVGGAGGVAVLLASVLASRRERRLVTLAVSIQEEFDTTVFQLPRNSMCVPVRPTGQQVHEAASRYTGNRTKNWYPVTGTVHRPLDVLICQQSNLGWGASIHRKWATAVLAAGIGLVAALAGVWASMRLDAVTGLNALVIPFLPLIWEALTETFQHFDAAKDKEEAQQLVLGLWRSSLSRPAKLSEVREVQNAIVGLRRANAQVPDWFDNRFRGRSEHAMRATAEDMSSEAARHARA